MSSFYKTKRWIRKRENILRRDNYLCQECRRYGKTTPANTVHHIYPLELYPEFGLVNENLLSCCTTCHGTFHDRMTNQITKKGIEWQNRVEHKLLQST